MTATANRVLFLRWVAKNHPTVYKSTVARLKPASELGRLGWINFVVQAVATVGSAVLGKKQVDKQVALQKKALVLSDAQAAADRNQAGALALLQLNTERAQKGLPPVDINNKVVSGSGLPVPAALRSYVTSSSGATLIPGVPNLVLYVAGGLALLFVARQAKLL